MDESSNHPLGAISNLLATWIAVMLHPNQFFHDRITPGEQAPGLQFAMVIVAVEESLRLATTPTMIPAVTAQPLLSAAITVALVVVLLTPVALHLIAALQTIILIALLENRGGVSETVQLLAYAAAPCALAGLPSPGLRLVVGLYGTGLLVLGLMRVHGANRWQAMLAAAIPAGVIFGYGFRGFGSALTIAREWHLI